MSVIQKSLAGIRHAAGNLVRTAKAIPAAIREAKADSYFSEQERKPYFSRLMDNLSWAFRYHESNPFYCLYGLDLVGHSDKEYSDYLSFMNIRNACNHAGKVDSQTILLRDKFLFYKYMNANGMPVPEVFAVVRNGVVYDIDLNPMSMDDLAQKTDYFVKDLDGECASFVKHIANYQEFNDVRSKLSKGSYILQKRMYQCDEMNVLNPKAINTMRVITINKDGKPFVFSALLRVGTEQTGNVDNWAVGGLSIGIEANGFLKEYGYYKPSYGLKADTHPDTGVVFREFQIPMFQEALDKACEAHKHFYGVHSIGWDVALSTDGPMFIEGNDNWEISMMQACDRPLKEAWLKACE